MASPGKGVVLDDGAKLVWGPGVLAAAAVGGASAGWKIFTCGAAASVSPAATWNVGGALSAATAVVLGGPVVVAVVVVATALVLSKLMGVTGAGRRLGGGCCCCCRRDGASLGGAF
jgi:hypothetical protein